jgi:peptidoglycan/LPS O-acetylase OafA/YrhL
MTRPAARTDHYPVFDLLRIVAALAVILSHSFPLTGRRMTHGPRHPPRPAGAAPRAAR